MTHVSFAKVEAGHPGFKAISGPFDHNHKAPSVRRAERAACFRAVKDHISRGVKAVIRIYDGKAYVLRDETGWITMTPGSNDEYRDVSGSLCRCSKKQG